MPPECLLCVLYPSMNVLSVLMLFLVIDKVHAKFCFHGRKCFEFMLFVDRSPVTIYCLDLNTQKYACNFYFEGVELHVLLNTPLQLFFMPLGIWFTYRPSYYLVNFGVPLCFRSLSIHVTLAWWLMQQGFKEFVPNHSVALFLVGSKFYAYIGRSNDAFQFNWFVRRSISSSTGSAKWRSTGFLVWQSGCYYNFEFNWCQNLGEKKYKYQNLDAFGLLPSDFWLAWKKDYVKN